jgi:hypothetical protein
VRRTIWAPTGCHEGIPDRGNTMRNFANAFLSAIAAVTISGTLFSAVLM